jgi:penicillin-binding protein 1C
MQTARLLEPRPRNLGSKLIEMVRAVQLEARLTKRETLALYLTLAPYGGNLEGVRAASLAYFGHEPTSLTDGEQALLIALPQSPEARRPGPSPRGGPRRGARCWTRWSAPRC